MSALIYFTYSGFNMFVFKMFVFNMFGVDFRLMSSIKSSGREAWGPSARLTDELMNRLDIFRTVKVEKMKYF